MGSEMCIRDRPAEMIVDAIRERGDDALAVKVNCADMGEVGLLGQHPWMDRGIDVLVLNHGVYNRVQGHAMTLDDLTTTMKTNFEGAVAVWKAVQPHLTAQARMVVVGSQLGTRGSPHGADYAASKAALSTWARSLAQSVGPEGKRGHARERRITQQLRNGNIVPAGTLTLGCVARVGEPTRDLDKLERAAEVKERITRA